MGVHNKVMTIGEAMSKIRQGSRVMIGEFVGAGEPLCCIDWLIEQAIHDLTLITNTPGFAGGDFGKSELFAKGLIKELIATHVGTTPESSSAYLEDRMMVKQFFPMGTWAEKVRAGGHGLGGILVPVGVGILDEEGLFPALENGKDKVTVNGQEFFVEEALTSDVSIIKGWRADEIGNVEFRFTSRQNQRDIAMAGDFTIVEVNEIVPVGTIKPQDVGCPAPFVDAVVQGHSLDVQQEIYRKRWVKAGKISQPAA
jgi:acetate CoA/acetoacetate CoA-transferase alpha subunit